MTTIAPTPLATAPTASDGPLVVDRLGVGQETLWDRFVAERPEGTFFHTTAWLNSVEAAFGHEPVHLVARRGDRWVGLLPLFRVRSLLAGTLLVSVPYAIYGGVVADDQRAADALLQAAQDDARAVGARCIDLRSARASFSELPRTDRYVTFQRPLPDEAREVLGWLPRKARAVARNARNRHGLTVRFDDDQLPLVWRLYCAAIRRVASLNYPYRFFEELIRRSPGGHLVSMIYHRDRPVGGLVSFLYGQTVLPYFVGLDPVGQRLGVGNFIYLTLAERAVAMGYRVFDFGRSRRDNTGCVNFKRFQGFEPTPLQYQCVTLPGCTEPDLTPSNPRFSLARRVWPRLPLAVTRRLGSWLTRHVPG
ncbi:MAG: FemAB family PEP-CTERM system-associated protein [Planctomycetes bacterium]|nr:FemAB family PEP-CTERM system-associated protein [Planctomycetota bacterium]